MRARLSATVVGSGSTKAMITRVQPVAVAVGCLLWQLVAETEALAQAVFKKLEVPREVQELFDALPKPWEMATERETRTWTNRTRKQTYKGRLSHIGPLGQIGLEEGGGSHSIPG